MRHKNRLDRIEQVVRDALFRCRHCADGTAFQALVEHDDGTYRTIQGQIRERGEDGHFHCPDCGRVMKTIVFRRVNSQAEVEGAKHER